jgi:3'(2'), 5'-bisphosphate nucleotidase
MEPKPDRANVELWEQARQHARGAALAAWRAIEPLYEGEYEIFNKADGPATEADRLADRLIVEALKTHYPPETYGYLTEESEDSNERLGRERVWIVDPIDGTKDFIKRNGNFAIQIALVERQADGRYAPVAGVVYRPTAERLYSAVAGGGTICERVAEAAAGPEPRHRCELSHACEVSRRSQLDRLRAVVSNSHRTSRMMRLIESLGLERYWPVGSLGVKICTIVEGEAELYVVTSLGMVKEWDSCAPHLILNEAGGRMTDLLGRPMTYNRPDPRWHCGLLASNGAIHDVLADKARRFLGSEGVELK